MDHVIDNGPRQISLEFMQAHGFNLYVFSAKDEWEYAQKLLDCEGLPDHMIQRLSYTSGISTTEILERIYERFRMP